MTSPLSATQVRELDRRTIEDVGIPGRVLMEVAGYGAFALVRQVLVAAPGGSGHVTVLAGQGNNAGDGFVLARFCSAIGLPVRVLTIGDPNRLTRDARVNFDLLEGFGIEAEIATGERLGIGLSETSLIVDALLGTGLRSAVRSPFREAIDAVNGSARPVLSLDLPSGLCGDSGQVLGTAVRAHWTATFGALKRGLLIGAGPQHAGEVHLVPLPFAPRLWSEVGAHPPGID